MMFLHKNIAKSQNVSALHVAFIMIIADISITIDQHVVWKNIGFETVDNQSVLADFFYYKVKLVLTHIHIHEGTFLQNFVVRGGF